MQVKGSGVKRDSLNKVCTACGAFFVLTKPGEIHEDEGGAYSVRCPECRKVVGVDAGFIPEGWFDEDGLKTHL